MDPMVGSRNHGTQRYREKRGQGDGHERRHRKVRKIHARFCLYGNLWFNGTVCKINGVGESSSLPQAVHVAILHRFFSTFHALFFRPLGAKPVQAKTKAKTKAITKAKTKAKARTKAEARRPQNWYFFILEVVKNAGKSGRYPHR